MMRAAERELREDLAPLVATGAIVELPHEGWLTTTAQFRASQAGPPWRMDAFYRHVRRETGILMRDGKPLGGKWSFDAENRRSWNGVPRAAVPPRFEPDPIKDEVVALVRERFASHPGALDPGALPATLAEAESVWMWARHACLPLFGPYEDAMSERSTTLFHTRIAPLLHLHRLLPRRVVEDAAGMRLPLASQEGFVRQILGWREFVRHVHEATDGFRDRPLREGGTLPPAYWGTPSGLRCLDTVVASVWREGYSHHITRLMVLANVATLLDVSPRELTDWFWAAYTDAYDWVVEPNVLGMGTFAAGDVMTTKPYVAGAAYLAKMGDSCRGCAFDPKTTCPITPLYWAWLGRRRGELEGIPRMTLPLAAEARRDPARRRDDAATFERVREALARGETLRPGC
jgi:deoxyribodipyrimidine photolyase-related protein